MFISRVARFPRKPFAELDYARHMPKEYVERMKRTVPKKVYDGRFGAPAITQWKVHPDDYEPTHKKPWVHEELQKSLERANAYHAAIAQNEFYELRRPKVSRMPDEQWTFFPGDLVQVMVGKDKGRQGTVVLVSRDTNEVLVEGMHTKLEKDMEGSAKLGLDETMRWKEQPLSVEKGQVSLVDPNDNEPCSAKWILSDGGDEYIRVSNKSGFEIPVPSQAEVTYEYVQADKYIEVATKDTPSNLVLTRTYVPKLASFEQEIMESMGIEEKRKHGTTYWY